MRQIVDGPQFFIGHQVTIVTLFQSQFHGKVTASKIHIIVQRWNDEFHGIDARGGGLDGDHAIHIDANVGRRHLENSQSRVDGSFGTHVSWRGFCHV